MSGTTINRKEKLIDGRTVAQLLENRLSQYIRERGLMESEVMQKEKIVREPHLTVILVGDHPPSLVYINQKRKACQRVGIDFTLCHLKEETMESELLEVIEKVNRDSLVDGVIVQLPLPSQICQTRVMEAISPSKDVDGFHPLSMGRLVMGDEKAFVPATPRGIQMLLEHYGIEILGRHCVIIGKSSIVGRPLANLLSLEMSTSCDDSVGGGGEEVVIGGGGEKAIGGTVTLCDRWTRNLKDFVKMADILVVCAGVHHLIKDSDWVKEGVVVIDVGIHQIPDETKKSGYRLEGDVDFESVSQKASLITPVPGGVGPMTVISLLWNTWDAYCLPSDGAR